MRDDQRWMQAALDEAKAAEEQGEVPIGAVVVRDGEVIGRGRNRREVDHDPSAHAEVVALREAGAAAGSWRLPEATMFVTLEPCAMCAATIIYARLERVVFAAPDPKAGAVVSLFELLDDARLNHRVRWEMGLAREESEGLLRRFFEARR